MHDRVITLIGMRGAGKTTVGRALARQLGWDFVDIDEEIVRGSGRSIAEIFAQSGEDAFRTLERASHTALVGRDRLVVSVGGGAVLDAANAEVLQSIGRSVWLTAPPEVLWQRVAGDPKSAANRPKLTQREGCAEFKALFEARRSLYAALAELTVETHGKRPEAVAAEIRQAINTGR